ncbi:MAG: hypothetical protein M1537_01765 [Nitrospirae bacterium]|nr:hypothetical protein [Nitrospirota bacterium]MCL5284196.1 hypothetical protein [Nitrospirota bacterium]
MKGFFLKAGKGLVFGGMLSCLVSGPAIAGETPSLPPGFSAAPPIPGIGGRYLGTEQILQVDRKSTPVIRCKSGYDSVLLFPGRKVRKIFLGGNWWVGAVTRAGGEGVVVIDPPVSPQVDSNLVVLFDQGVMIFRLKTVSPDKPFMARTIVRMVANGGDQRPK